MHGLVYDGSYGPKDIAGPFYFYGGGYGPAGYERGSSIKFKGWTPILGGVNSNGLSLGIGTEYLIGGAKGGLGYTINLSDIGRFVQGYKTRSND